MWPFLVNKTEFYDNSKVVNNTNVESSRAEGPPVGRPQKGNRDPVIIFLLLKKLILIWVSFCRAGKMAV